MRTLTYEGIVTALSSISHNGGESNGNIMSLRREKRILPNGKVADVPMISGNAIRGILRDAGMYYMLKQLGYGIDEKAGTIKGIPLEKFYFLFSGGSLTSTGESGTNVDAFRKLRKTLPLISLFGGASGNGIMPGKLSVKKMTPICKETIHLLPEWCKPEGSLLSCYDLCQLETYTRRDDARNDLLLDVLEPKKIEQPTPAVKGKPVTKPVQQFGLFGEMPVEEAEPEPAPVAVKEEKKAGAPQQMIYTVETLAAGTRFHWGISLQDPTQIEVEAFTSAVLAFAQHPYIGGKSAVGHGEIQIKLNESMEINSHKNIRGDELDMQPGKRYMQFLDEQGDEIRAYLESVVK